MSVDHPLLPEPSRPRRSRMLAPLGAGAALVTVGLAVGVTVNFGAADTLPRGAGRAEHDRHHNRDDDGDFERRLRAIRGRLAGLRRHRGPR